MKQAIDDFTNNTSGHGWGLVGRTKSKFGKILWGTITIASTIAAIAWVTTIVERYVRFETKDRVEIRGYMDIVFPSITVCPLYGYSVLKLGEEYMDPDNSAYLIQNNFLVSTLINIGELQKLVNDTSISLFDIISAGKSNRGFYENIGIREISEMSHDLESLIPYCLYQGAKCSYEDFQLLVHHEYKNCYTFNGGDVNLTKPNIRESGTQNGLSLTMYLDHTEFAYGNYDLNRAVTAASGARVVIHEKGTLPDPDNEGFDVEPGHLINVALTVNRRELMKPPWGKCADHINLESTDFKYTRNTCKTKCMEKMITHKCGCIKDLLPVDLEAIEDNNMQACGKINIPEWLKVTAANVSVLKEDIARFKCHNEKFRWSTISETLVGCDCEHSCSYNTYNIETSQSEWPMRGSELDFYCGGIMSRPGYAGSPVFNQFHQKVGVHCINYAEYINVSEKWGDKIRANFLRVNVYFKDLETKVTIEEEDFPLVSMVSEIGGVLGIFIGVSIITMLEVFVLCSNIVYSLFDRKKVSTEVQMKNIMSTPKTNSENLFTNKPDDSYNDKFERY